MRRIRKSAIWLVAFGLVATLAAGAIAFSGPLTTQLRGYAVLHAVGLTPLVSRLPLPRADDMLPFPPETHAMDCRAITGRPLTVLVLGQSNGANTAGRPLPPAHLSDRSPVADSYALNLLDGQCSRLLAPLPGVFGNGNSPWPSFAEELRRQIDRPVIIAAGSVGSSTVGQWREDSPFAERPPAGPWLEILAKRVQEFRGQPDIVIWFQGENDAILQTGREEYEAAFLDVRHRLRKAGISAPIVMSNTSVCRAPAVEAVRQAQRNLIGSLADVHEGPDTDSIPRDPEYRRDGCHFTSAAIRRIGRMFAQSVLKNGTLAGQ